MFAFEYYRVITRNSIIFHNPNTEKDRDFKTLCLPRKVGKKMW